MPLSPDVVRERYARIREEVGPGVTVVAATKYVSADDLGVLAEAGVEVAGENRLQDLAAKHARFGDAFRWHFIGHLQSRKARDVSELCELVPLARERLGGAAARRSRRWSRSTSPASRRSRASAPDELTAFLDDAQAAGAQVRGLMTMPPLAEDPEASRPYFSRLRELAAEHGLPELSMGTSQDYRVAAEEGATLVRVGSVLCGS